MITDFEFTEVYKKCTNFTNFCIFVIVNIFLNYQMFSCVSLPHYLRVAIVNDQLSIRNASKETVQVNVERYKP